ncbi:HEPN domain-containing protein [Desulfofundulus thermosubterraneus]|uniref:HEPN domain-containing protein n=1 Tax=Desulfofundulus thermosubterraneus DSM 16057 TaxID=1121432 RepID=A0A1M6HMA3_9FIRM|nr:HEPN domain-containing protein [Desulfofundulus thermosubterraneus]SHJ23302.1 HEPN domain-containing protein [Desulfofundulus thermosubterraneus DSM 16057]
MKTDELSAAYLKKARVRFKALNFYKENEAYSDVVREAQELVELLLKAVLRAIGVEVPKIHDVGRTLEKHRHLLPPALNERLDEVKKISKRLRKERELSFYGAEDFIPTEEYGLEDADMAIRDAEFVLKAVEEAFEQ